MSVDDNKGSIRYLFVFYSIPIRPNVKIDKHEGTKKVRETSDIVMGLPTENTKDTKKKMHMKSKNIEPQNTQKCAEIYNGSREGQEKSFCVFLRCLRLKITEDTKERKKRFVFFVKSVGNKKKFVVKT